LLAAGIDDSNFLLETNMATITSKLTALTAALIANSLILGAVGYLFEVQSHPHLSVLSFARQVATHPWFT
jgi:hypothetical protein